MNEGDNPMFEITGVPALFTIVLGICAFLATFMIKRVAAVSETLSVDVRVLSEEMGKLKSVMDVITKSIQGDIAEMKAEINQLRQRSNELGNEVLIARMIAQKIGEMPISEWPKRS